MWGGGGGVCMCVHMHVCKSVHACISECTHVLVNVYMSVCLTCVYQINITRFESEHRDLKKLSKLHTGHFKKPRQLHSMQDLFKA